MARSCAEPVSWQSAWRVRQLRRVSSLEGLASLGVHAGFNLSWLLFALVAPIGCADSGTRHAMAIAFSQRTSFGDRDGPGIVNGPYTTVCDQSGTFYYTDFRRKDVAVFDSSGAYLRSIGREGSGPGEFRQPYPLLFVHDSLFVVDRSNARVSVYNTAGTLVRIAPFAVAGPINQGGIAVLSSGAIVASTPRSLPNSSDRLLGLAFLGEDGKIRGAFGSDTFAVRDVSAPGVPWRRLLAPARDGGFWAAQPYEYRIDKWDAIGRLERTLVVSIEWFPRARHAPSGNRVDTGLPGPNVVDLREDGDGLWVAISAEAIARARNSQGSRETVVHLLNPATGTVQAEARLPIRAAGFACDRMLTSYAEDADGYPVVQRWPLTLR